MNQSLTFRFITFLLFCVLMSGAVFAQSTFQRIYERPASNDVASSIIPTADGYLIAGSARSVGTNSWDASLIKTDYDGNILWQKTYGFTGGGLDDFYHVTETNDGGFLAVGSSSGFENGPTDLIMVKTDADGNPLWQKHISGSSSNFSEWGNFILPVSGGYLISGTAATKIGSVAYYSGLLLRTDYNGDVLWMQKYSSGTSHTRHLSARYISGDTLFACGQRDSAGIFALINAATGNLIAMQSFDGAAFTNDAFQSMAEASNGDFLLAGQVDDVAGQKQWVCRVSRTGELKWSKVYSDIGQGVIISLSDDHFLLITRPAIVAGNLYDPILVKIDGNGDVVWSEKYGKAGTDVFSAALETPDGGIIAVGSTRPLNNNTLPVTLVVKTDENGRVAGCCRQPFNVTAIPYQVMSNASGFTQSAFFDPVDFTLIADENMLTPLDYCPAGPSEQLSDTVFICPGDSVLIGSAYYNAPGTVVYTLPGTPCDTVVTYTIQYADPGNASVINVQCPVDLVVQAPPGTTAVAVDFDTPDAYSDCLCPGIDIVQVQGPASGSAFPVGTHSVCFLAQDGCGNSAGCCFQVSVVEAEDACDVKTGGCTTFELLRITRDAAWRRTYHIRITNNCVPPLVYAAFQLPDGVVADAPVNGNTHISPGGHPYSVRNPNHSPFHSIRFTAQGAGIQGGASDVFQYTLPPQSAPDYIHAIVKTGSQTYSEAHLNTFNCPVTFDPDASKPIEERNTEMAFQEDAIHLFPNPTSGVLFVRLKSGTGAVQQVRIFDARGNLVYTQYAGADEQVLKIDLPTGMVAGLYLAETTVEGGSRLVKRFMFQ